jgi:GDP-mannose 6-dehydrogenase
MIKPTIYRIGVYGMGYVGCVSAACLARDGHQVTGVDVSPAKVQAIAAGRSPVDEPGLPELIREMAAAGRLKSAFDPAAVVEKTDVSLICVGTPSRNGGGIDFQYVERVCAQIGEALKQRAPGHVIVVRSTVLPGTMEGVVGPAIENFSGLRQGRDFFCAFNPEFLREGTSIADYENPPKIVVGTEHEAAARVLKDIYGRFGAPMIVTSPRVAELVKYVDNAWHALKITFANEIGGVCRLAGVDSHAVMDIFMQDTHLNISKAYLRPGFAFGGSCLPKDLRALLHFARHGDLELPVLERVLASNNRQVEQVFQRILDSGARRVGIYGLSFKPKTDDLRESPLVTLAERLVGKGIELRIFDEFIQIDRLTGSNKEYIDRHLPHLMRLMVNGFEAFEGFAELVVIGHATRAAGDWVNRNGHSIRIIDLARIAVDRPGSAIEGIYW